jgi:hypothetical protein
MQIEFKKVEPNKRSLSYELIFTFRVFDIKPNEVPIQFKGELRSEDDFKIGDLVQYNSNTNYFYLNAQDAIGKEISKEFEIQLHCEFGKRAINHIESYRLNKKEQSKDIIFVVDIVNNRIESNILISHLHLGEVAKGGGNLVSYKHGQYYGGIDNGMYIMSAGSKSNFLKVIFNNYGTIRVQIDLMDWINKYCQYLDIGNFLVFEFQQPEKTVFSSVIKERYDKAQNALNDMQRQLNYGEWKMAIICIRPVFELFKNFEDFKSLLLESGYSEPAYDELKKSIKNSFGFVSKFYHALDESYVSVNPDIPAQKEDAYFAYSYSVSLLHLVSQKLKRKGT